jgi:hypothetical protein
VTPADLMSLTFEFVVGIAAAGVIAAVVILATAVLLDVRHRAREARRHRRPRNVVIEFVPSASEIARASRGSRARRIGGAR